jgi:hypothetical protein
MDIFRRESSREICRSFVGNTTGGMPNVAPSNRNPTIFF